jgi:hypothetical protein
MTDTLRELWDQINAGRPPVAAMTQIGDRQKHRRSRHVVGAIAATLAIMGSGVAVQQLTAPGSGREPTSNSPMIPTPPPGTRWVGLGRAVVAVPDQWTTGDAWCSVPAEDTVFFNSTAGSLIDCLGRPGGADPHSVSALAVLSTRPLSSNPMAKASSSFAQELLKTLQPAGTVDGHEVLELDQCTQPVDQPNCDRYFAVPSEGVIFSPMIQEPTDGNYDAIRDSLRILPEGLTTVPLISQDGWTPAWGAEPDAARALIAQLQASGLHVEVEQAASSPDASHTGLPAGLQPGSYLGANPELGSPIEEGGGVTITLAGPTATGSRAQVDLTGLWSLTGASVNGEDFDLTAAGGCRRSACSHATAADRPSPAAWWPSCTQGTIRPASPSP